MQSDRRTEAFDRIAARELKTLPEDYSERKQVLDDLIHLMPNDHRMASELRDLVSLLYQHDLLQRELPLRFVQERKSPQA